MPVDNYAAFADDGQIPVKLEPPNAQQIYAVLDVRDAEVLTDQNAEHRRSCCRRPRSRSTRILAAVK